MYNIQSHFTYLCLLYFALTYFVCLLFRRNKQKYHDTFLVCILSQELLVIQSSHGIHTSIKQIKAPFNPERNAQYTSVFTFMYWTHYSHPISLRYLILQSLLSSCVDTVLFYEQNADCCDHLLRQQHGQKKNEHLHNKCITLP